MEQLALGEVQKRFAKIIWANAPIPSGELVKLCEKELGWKKPTTYTVLRKLCSRGLFENVNGVVQTRISQATFSTPIPSSTTFFAPRIRIAQPTSGQHAVAVSKLSPARGTYSTLPTFLSRNHSPGASSAARQFSIA